MTRDEKAIWMIVLSFLGLLICAAGITLSTMELVRQVRECEARGGIHYHRMGCVKRLELI